MNPKKMVLGEENPTPAQQQAILDANAILNSQGLELIGTRPKDR